MAVIAARNEASILSRISHTNILKYVDFVQDNYSTSLYTELCGPSLKHMNMFNRNAVMGNEWRFFLPILNALHYLHYNTIVHRDVKSENVVLRVDGTPVLIDFGLANKFFDSKSLFMITPGGTRTHISPEIAANKLYDAYSADAWALGIFFIELLYGDVLWSISNPMEDEKFQVFSTCQVLGMTPLNALGLISSSQVPIDLWGQFVVDALLTIRYKRHLSGIYNFFALKCG